MLKINKKDHKIKRSSKLNIRKFINWGFLGLLYIGVPLLTAELFMIVAEPYLFKGFFQYDPDLGFRVNPDTPRTNQYGFNDRDYPLEKAPGNYRIVAIGDSYSWAGDLDGNYTAILEKQFQAYYGAPKVEVINVGFPMADPPMYLEMLKKYGLKFNPDLVILGFFVGNDLHTPVNQKRIVLNDTFIDVDRTKEVKLFGYPLIGQSRVWLFLQQRYRMFQEQLKLQQAQQQNQGKFELIEGAVAQESPTPSPSPEPPTLYSEETFLEIERWKLEINNIPDYQTGKFTPQFEYSLQAVVEMANILKEQNIPFLVAIYPSEYQIDRTLASRIFTAYELNPENYDLELPQKVVIETLEAHSIDYLDMLEPFQEAGKDEVLYILRDTHWNLKGNQLAANLLFQRLKPLTMNNEQLTINN
ncbi:hypothetical protein PJF56_06685 [Roseofilum sp. BLCC_M91]|uniref:AlgX/AlgJ SGNH hydrolase-like domain-containing protein n=1 Tax=Roseofilum halophilum BLCC-M91 TaxID=3022259 RepID=A0ABT7BH77_9CYAN|nr:hypothetical protein [Roseofilum halophilum]MDJ1178543.1 hypothetical protein [Roseofilum halophilum BLCC-M91]